MALLIEAVSVRYVEELEENFQVRRSKEAQKLKTVKKIYCEKFFYFCLRTPLLLLHIEI
jgi:predicted LPLAT superfamily acyltransferase